MGNLVPLIPSVLVAIIGLRLGVLGAGLGVVVAIPLISRFGFWENKQIRLELHQRYPQPGILVGFVFDKPADWLDAHAEVGLMCHRKGQVLIQTEDRLVVVPCNAKTIIGRQFNIHQLIGLGGWIKIENEGMQTLLIESREHDTMLASKGATKALFDKLQKEKGGS